MKTKTDLEFIDIPAVARVPAFKLDPRNRTQVASLIVRAESFFKLSARAWERGNNSGDAAILRQMEAREKQMADNGAALLKPLGIECDWPGLYPSFQVNGAHEYTTANAVLTALGHPRNWLNP